MERGKKLLKGNDIEERYLDGYAEARMMYDKELRSSMNQYGFSYNKEPNPDMGNGDATWLEGFNEARSKFDDNFK